MKLLYILLELVLFVGVIIAFDYNTMIGFMALFAYIFLIIFMVRQYKGT